ncbi:MAG: transferase hexapeptide repeat family protein [Rhodospirillales bacterium]|nr:transferase hexapeptide repeat family protein [Rhodospirillales bacterium]
MVKVYAIEGVIPVVHPEAFVHPTAVLIGDVHVGPGCYIGPGASLRGDFGRIVLGTGCNVQDNCIIHSYPRQETVVEDDGHIGHGAILHCCQVRKNALIGMGAVVMDDAEIGEGAYVAAQAFVKAGFVVPPGMLAAGIPARVLREVGPEEQAWKKAGTAEYQRLTKRCLVTMEEVDALTAIEADRPALDMKEMPFLHQMKGR